MFIYVQAKDGAQLMPTSRYGKVRRMLRDGSACVVSRTPFTIRLNYDTTHFTQAVTLGVDAGSKTVGLSASTEAKELYRSEVTLRNDIVSLLSTRRESRRTRRSRKLRYRAPRFDNRVSARKDGWLAPSVRQKVDSHVRVIGSVCSILPIKTVIVEVAQFDVQWIKSPGLTGTDYQHGEQYGFWNVREYVLYRDGHRCRCCHGKSKDNILNVHHIESRKTGGDSPDNLVTLCETCHKAYHAGKIRLKLKRSPSLRDAAAMNVMRWAVYNRLKAEFAVPVQLTYGYKTKCVRIENDIEKSHCADAFCIAGNIGALRMDGILLGRCIARHNRSLHRQVTEKGGRRRSTVAPHYIGASKLQRFDTVLHDGKECIVSGSTNGRPVLRTIDWKLATHSASVNYKTIKFLARKHSSILYQYIKYEKVNY